MTQLNARLKELPPPNHEDGSELARGAIETTAAFGEFYPRYGTRLVAIPAQDEATILKVLDEYALERPESGPMISFYPRKLAPEIQKAVLTDVPGCHDFWAWMGGEPLLT